MGSQLAGCPSNPKKGDWQLFCICALWRFSDAYWEGQRDGGCLFTYVFKAKDDFLGGVKPEGEILVCESGELVSL